MKSKHYFIALTAFLCGICVSCSEDPVVPEVSVADGTVNYFSESMDFPSIGGTKVLNFTSNVKWTLKVSDAQNTASWCTLSQSEGGAGSYNIAITTGENAGYNDRNVVLVFTAGDLTRNVIVNQKQKDAITLTTDRFEVSEEGGQITVETKSNVNYSVEIPSQYQSWIKPVSQTRALTSKKLSFDILESKEYDKREGEIIFSSGDIVERVKVYQSGKAILVLSQNEYTLGSEGGIMYVDISSNFEFDVDMPDVEWVKMAATRTVSSHTLAFQVEENPTYDDRETIIVFKDTKSEKKESVSIKQRQKDAIILSNEKMEIGQEGGNISVSVNTNVDYTVEIPAFCGWISVSSTRALSPQTSTFFIEENTELDKREGEIYFIHEDIADTLKIYQSGGAILVLNKNSYELEGGAATISVELKSNIEYTVSISEDWISEVSTRAVSSSTKNFNISTNKTGKSRTGEITFMTSDGKKSSTVTITQASLIEANSLSIKFTNTSGTINSDLYIGKDYEFSVSSVPSNATTDYEWQVEDTNIATISGDGSNAYLHTKDFGRSKVIVTERNSGVSATYDFGTLVTDFKFTETSRDTQYGYPVITIAIGGSHQLKYSCSPSYATKVFGNLKAFNFKELNTSINTYVVVGESSIVDIDENGFMTAKKIGTTIINSNNGFGVFKEMGANDGIFVKVVQEITPYGSIGGHRYVDLDLPSGKLWATENFGGYSETDYGAYYLWSSADKVPVSWGLKWNTPTVSEFEELLSNCSYEWTSKNNIQGYLFTGSNGATMFLPAAGFKIYTEGFGYSNVQSGGSYMLYWTISSSTFSWEGHSFAFALQGTSSSLDANSSCNTSVTAAPIRPISR